MLSRCNKGLLAALGLLLSSMAAAQLPELGSPSAASGGSTTARFFAGASADNGLSFADTFAFDQPVDITGEIEVESGHVGTVGNLYLVVQLGEDLLIRNSGGEYIPWDMDIATLQATTVGKTLSAAEPLTIVDDVALGPAGVSGVTFSVFFAYDTEAVPGELYYSGVPLNVTINVQEETQAQSLTLFTQNISSQIIQSNCIQCHVSGGLASNTRLVYARSTTPDFQTINYNDLLDFVRTAGSTLLINKPQGIGHGGGTRLSAGSADLANWIEFVNALEADS